MRQNGKPFSFYSPKREEPDADQAISLILNGKIDDFKQLLSQCPPLVNTKDKFNGNVFLHVACSKGDLSLASYLISHGAETNIQDIFGNAPLHYAVDKCKLSVAEMLLNNAANSNLQDFRGNSPLHIACINNDVEAVKLLLKYNADPDMPDRNGIKPREKVQSPYIRSLIDRRIHALHEGEQEQANQVVQFLSLGVGLGKVVNSTFVHYPTRRVYDYTV
jgi:ankyrin repeat protein